MYTTPDAPPLRPFPLASATIATALRNLLNHAHELRLQPMEPSGARNVCPHTLLHAASATNESASGRANVHPRGCQTGASESTASRDWRAADGARNADGKGKTTRNAGHLRSNCASDANVGPYGQVRQTPTSSTSVFQRTGFPHGLSKLLLSSQRQPVFTQADVIQCAHMPADGPENSASAPRRQRLQASETLDGQRPGQKNSSLVRAAMRERAI